MNSRAWHFISMRPWGIGAWDFGSMGRWKHKNLVFLEHLNLAASDFLSKQLLDDEYLDFGTMTLLDI